MYNSHACYWFLNQSICSYGLLLRNKLHSVMVGLDMGFAPILMSWHSWIIQKIVVGTHGCVMTYWAVRNWILASCSQKCNLFSFTFCWDLRKKVPSNILLDCSKWHEFAKMETWCLGFVCNNNPSPPTFLWIAKLGFSDSYSERLGSWCICYTVLPTFFH